MRANLVYPAGCETLRLPLTPPRDSVALMPERWMVLFSGKLGERRRHCDEWLMRGITIIVDETLRKSCFRF